MEEGRFRAEECRVLKRERGGGGRGGGLTLESVGASVEGKAHFHLELVVVKLSAVSFVQL